MPRWSCDEEYALDVLGRDPGLRRDFGRESICSHARQWDSDFSVFGPPFDDNTAYQFHTYWTPPAQATIQKHVDFRDRMKVPIWLGESGENTDEWVGQFARLLEMNDIAWAFWPYKKMDATPSAVSFAQPEDWSEITAYAQAAARRGRHEGPHCQAAKASDNRSRLRQSA